VESPSKAKTISGYCKNFKDFDKINVIASVGHVRSIISRSGAVRPDNDFEVDYETIAKPSTIEGIKKLTIGANNLYLATDPDREGEAIAWHVLEVLKELRVSFKNINVKRVVFNEITSKAVIKALKNPREIDLALVYAQQARQILDYLVGFTLSPVLWRKLPGSRSAGRVQSVALRLVCEREHEIDKFLKEEYWDISVDLNNSKNKLITAGLYIYNNEKLEKFSLTTAKQCEDIIQDVDNSDFIIDSIDNKKSNRSPYAPFTTSTLQQEASNKLSINPRNTMRIAQKLYEGVSIGKETIGLITYMRTDSISISEDAIKDIRNLIKKDFGAEYLPDSSRKYISKVKNAQEAHEAIRPTDVSRTPKEMKSHLTAEQLSLYELIWNRAVASQMTSAIIDTQVIIFSSIEKASTKLKAVGSVIAFMGFYILYKNNQDTDKILPKMDKGEKCTIEEITPNQHFTQPPPRYSESSLVKKMEELGIGRPSTYATIISVIQERGYVLLENRRLAPKPLGVIVHYFLLEFFPKYVEYDFTASLEEELDLISNDKKNYKEFLKYFWYPFNDNIKKISDINPIEIMQSIENNIEYKLFSVDENGDFKKDCPKCSNKLNLRTGKNGPFLSCSSYPKCNYIKGIGDSSNSIEYPIDYGYNEELKGHISIRSGSYGLYCQLNDDKNEMIRRTSIPSGVEVTNDVLVFLLSLPKVIGLHPSTNKEIALALGRYGPYIKYEEHAIAIKSFQILFKMTLEETIILVDKKLVAVASLVKKIGKFQKFNIELHENNNGFYLKYGRSKIPISSSVNTEAITLEIAGNLIDEYKKNK